MAAKKCSIITDNHKSIILLRYEDNPKFKRSELAKELGVKPMVVINFIHKHKIRTKKEVLFTHKGDGFTNYKTTGKDAKKHYWA